MSETSGKLQELNQLPIFPLPIVLFPNELLPLHIFEPRYKKMLEDIQEDNNIFGVSYFRAEEAATSNRPPIGSIGCATEVREIQRLPDGRSNILTIGLARYVIERYVNCSKPYLIAEVSYFEDDEEDEELLKPLADEVFQTFVKIAKMAHDLSGEKGKMPEIPQAEPQILSFLIGASFNLSPEEKYKLLQTRSTFERLSHLSKKLKEIVTRIETTTKTVKVAQSNGHTGRKIEF